MLNDLFLLGKLTGLGLVILLPLANPLTSMTMLLSLGQHIPYKERARQIRQAACYVVGIMLVTYYAGAWIMSTFGISIPGLRIAGGLIVMVLGFSMLFPKAQPRTRPRSSRRTRRPGAAPPQHRLRAAGHAGHGGPGTIAMIISAASSMNSDELAHVPAWVLAVVPIVVFALLGLIFWICLTSAGKIVALIGHEGVEAISRVMGFLLVCMGVQFVINGVLEIAHGLP